MKDKKFLKVLRESLKSDLEHLEGQIRWYQNAGKITMVAYVKGQREATERLLVDIERHYDQKDYVKVGGTD